MKVGDPTKQSFLDMWAGAQRKEVMERLDASKDCNFHCLRHDTNRTAIDLKQKLGAGVQISMVEEEFDRFI